MAVDNTIGTALESIPNGKKGLNDRDPLMQTPYVHKALSRPANFRLMRLEPGNFGDDIWFTLVETDQDENHKYHAISYAWGSTQLTHFVYSTDGHMKITQNLWSALRRYRLTDRTMLMWVDAICISQADLNERAQQVLLMGTIFSKSSGVFVWLGEELETDQTTLDFITRQVDAWNALPKNAFDDANDRLNFRKKLLAEAEEGGHLEGIARVLDRGWFSRGWTFQEVVVCPQDAILSYGPRKIVWKVLAEFAVEYFILGIAWSLRSPSAGVSIIHIAQRYYQRKYFHDVSDKTSFLAAVASGRGRNCTDPRDKIYSVLGMARQSNPLPYPPDYKVDVSQLYTDFALHSVRQTRLLEVIKYCLFEQSNSSQPTWAPDWLTEYATMMLEVSPGELFRASNDTQVHLLPSKQSSELLVEGIVLDTITDLSGTLQLQDRVLHVIHNVEDPLSKKWIRWEPVLECLNRQKKFLQETFALASRSAGFADSDDRYEAWWRTMVCDKEQTKVRMDETQLGRATSEAKRKFRIYEDYVKNVGSNADIFSLPFEDALWAQEIEMLLLSQAMHRKICLTRCGSIGWVPEVAQEGDFVTILFGCSTPVLLRPRGDSFIVLGECYIHGIMDGEAMTEENLSKVQPICLV